jgi:hypothetical protein
MGVFVPVTGAAPTAGTPVGAGIGPYTRSKIAAELVARGCQQAGSPVVITYPAVVQGPHDPHLGDSVRFVRDLLRGRLPVLPRGRLSFVDVRDVGALHAAVLRPGQGARRYLLGGPAVEVTEVAALLGELTGHRLPQRTAPDWVLQHSGRLADRVQRLLPVRLPAGRSSRTGPANPAAAAPLPTFSNAELSDFPCSAGPGRSAATGVACNQRCDSSRLLRVVSGAHDPGRRGGDRPNDRSIAVAV